MVDHSGPNMMDEPSATKNLETASHEMHVQILNDRNGNVHI